MVCTQPRKDVDCCPGMSPPKDRRRQHLGRKTRENPGKCSLKTSEEFEPLRPTHDWSERDSSRQLQRDAANCRRSLRRSRSTTTVHQVHVSCCRLRTKKSSKAGATAATSFILRRWAGSCVVSIGPRRPCFSPEILADAISLGGQRVGAKPHWLVEPLGRPKQAGWGMRCGVI